MKYIEAFEHFNECRGGQADDQNGLFMNAVKSNKIVEWDLLSRCRNCQCVSAKPINFCKCGLYCGYCVAHDEICVK